ncbi:hypothetical protein DI392_07795 [Vibrio albus]|jgi:hypothetical protein|uniref:SHOCT domain-containing protein n=1 Tax=Vibrio albus TaxID=2200953 RepID=A0A2U3BBB2_9VIBR|nr:SHOCT domain-containing protein [Vibrio albus]PWI34086.1 hypothetical protein DI392_07795 [Vibrio albus]
MSSTSSHTTLNQLAQRYANGELDRATYLALRAELLEKLVRMQKNPQTEKPWQTGKHTKKTEPVKLEKPGNIHHDSLLESSPDPQEELPLARILITASLLLLLFISAVYLYFML